MGLALFVGANVEGCPRLPTIYDDPNLRGRTFSVALGLPVLTFIERVGALVRT